jgi:hypothetical protein
VEEERRRVHQLAAIDAQAAALRDAGIRQEDDPAAMADALRAAGIAGVVVGEDGKIAPQDIIRIADGGAVQLECRRTIA